MSCTTGQKETADRPPNNHLCGNMEATHPRVCWSWTHTPTLMLYSYHHVNTAPSCLSRPAACLVFLSRVRTFVPMATINVQFYLAWFGPCSTAGHRRRHSIRFFFCGGGGDNQILYLLLRLANLKDLQQLIHRLHRCRRLHVEKPQPPNFNSALLAQASSQRPPGHCLSSPDPSECVCDLPDFQLIHSPAPSLSVFI